MPQARSGWSGLAATPLYVQSARCERALDCDVIHPKCVPSPTAALTYLTDSKELAMSSPRFVTSNILIDRRLKADCSDKDIGLRMLQIADRRVQIAAACQLSMLMPVAV